MIKKLSKAPLQEVIFEVRWSQPMNQNYNQRNLNNYDR
jgi:hypothetical protein